MSELELADTIEDTTDAPDGPEAGADDGQPSAAADTDGAATPDPVEPAATPAWSPDDPAFRDAVAQEATAVAQAQVAAYLEQLGGHTGNQPEQPDEGFPEIDLFADDAVPQLVNAIVGTLGQQIEGLLDSRLGPIQQRYERESYDEAEERAKDIVASFESQHGEYLAGDDARGIVYALGDVFVAETVRRYGTGPRAAEAALAKADALVRKIEKAADQRGYTRAESELGGLAGARREPAGGGSGTVVSLNVPGNELDVADAYLARLSGE